MQTFTATTTSTITNARHVASKVATDLKRMQRLFGLGIPTDEWIGALEKEAIMLLDSGYLKQVSYGFISNVSGKWLYAVKYEAHYGQLSGGGDDPGGILPGDASNSHFNSFLFYSPEWQKLPHDEQQKFKDKLPFQRFSGVEPGIEGGGSWVYDDRRYSSGNIHLGRSIARHS
jgi:hypothetical protein